MKNLIAALYKAKLEFPTIKKDMNNPFFKRKYDDMKIRGFVLMKNDKGEDFWVGYGD